MRLPPGLRHVLAETKLYTDARDYVILRLPIEETAAATEMVKDLDSPFVGMTRDKDELTLVLSREEWEGQSPLVEVFEESPDYRLITFDIPLELGLVGYLATLVSALAEAGVSVFSLSAFSRDHVFVPAEDFEQAWEALRALIRTCQAEEAAEVYE
ncbi:MAG: ACT domain-containing protein [Anaerolineae bacterium]